MVRLTRYCLKETGWEEIKFSYLRDCFLDNPVDNPIFRNVKDSQEWISMAMQYGIYSYREIRHPVDPDAVATWLSLNKDNSWVSTALNERESRKGAIRIILIALGLGIA